MGLRAAIGAEDSTSSRVTRIYRHWRAISASECRKCSANLWSGYDNDEVAGLAVVDLGVFVTHEGERWAILEDRETWSYTMGPARIQWRTPWHRRALRAGSPTLIVVEHRCGCVVPDELRFRPPRRRSTPSKLQTDIPF